MKTMMGLINLDHEQHFYQELAYFRSGGSIPFAGRYRLIDFPLSNMAHSNISEVALFTSSKFRSLMDHLGTGRNWGFGRINGGLFILPPDWHDPSDISRGDLRFFHNNRDFFRRGKSDYVLITGSQFISNSDYTEAFQAHLTRDADVTLITTEVKSFKPEHTSQYRVEADNHGWVSEITHDHENPHIFTGAYIINKDLLMNLVDDCIAHHENNFFEAGVAARVKELKVQTYAHEGYGEFVNSVESYYRHSMNLLTGHNYSDLFYKQPFVKTKIGNQPPTKYHQDVNVTGSIIANGCHISGTVEDSILFRGVKVAKGASVKNSIIMQRCQIEPGVHLENVILDKDVRVTEGKTIMGLTEKPFVVAKTQTI